MKYKLKFKLPENVNIDKFEEIDNFTAWGFGHAYTRYFLDNGLRVESGLSINRRGSKHKFVWIYDENRLITENGTQRIFDKLCKSKVDK